MMEGQLSIFDVMADGEDIDRDLEVLPEEEMVAIIANKTGIQFTGPDNMGFYTAKPYGKKTATYSIKYSRLSIDPHCKIIMTDFMNHKKQSGAGSPCRSLKEAIAFIRKYTPDTRI